MDSDFGGIRPQGTCQPCRPRFRACPRAIVEPEMGAAIAAAASSAAIADNPRRALVQAGAADSGLYVQTRPVR
ncbi:tRNA dimethylallyltransferase (fragment) [Cupriavidus taiwanensis]|uniref:tRNA dimethylallyltransferase n=1 Tax=Cupriavidus taiwanensis TaxID=164546 RepID=A0A375J2P3_9BURK